MRKNRNRARQQAEDHRKHPEDETDGKTGNQKKSEYRKLQSDPDLYCALPGDIQCIVPWQRKAGGCTFPQKRRFGAGILPRGCGGRGIFAAGRPGALEGRQRQSYAISAECFRYLLYRCAHECRSGAPGRAGAGLGTENVSGAFLEGISPGRL